MTKRIVTAKNRGGAVGGDVKDSVIATGDGGTIEDLCALVAELRQKLPAQLEPETREDVEEAVQVVERQLAKPEPKRSVVLKNAKTILDLLSSAASVGKGLVPLAQRLGELAASVLV